MSFRVYRPSELRTQVQEGSNAILNTATARELLQFSQSHVIRAATPPQTGRQSKPVTENQLFMN
jgi:hypothetical protein